MTRTRILSQIRHIVVVMLENRSFDNMCGWLYRDAPQPSLYLPASSASIPFDGLRAGLLTRSRKHIFTDGPVQHIRPSIERTQPICRTLIRKRITRM